MLTFADRVGQEIGLSDWVTIDQARIDLFARATDDLDPMHIDPVWAGANSPFHSTIAFGFLTLSMLTALSRQALGWREDSTVDTGGYAINYGIEKLRFVAPVPVNSRIRARFVMLEARQKSPGELINRFGVTIEIENQSRPALVAEWLGLWVSGEEAHRRIEGNQP